MAPGILPIQSKNLLLRRVHPGTDAHLGSCKLAAFKHVNTELVVNLKIVVRLLCNIIVAVPYLTMCYLCGHAGMRL